MAAFAGKFLPAQPGHEGWEGREGLGRLKAVCSTIPIHPAEIFLEKADGNNSPALLIEAGF